MRLHRALGALLLATPLLGALPAGASPAPGAPHCPIFPASNVWHSKVTKLPVHPRNAAWRASMGAATRKLHPDFGPSYGEQPVPYGIPFNVLGNAHQVVSVRFYYGSESTPVRYPLGSDTKIEGGSAAGGDRHALMVNRDSCKLYEVYDTHYLSGGKSWAGSGAAWNLKSNTLRHDGYTSADAAGLPIFPGLVRYDEVQAGVVDHPIRFTASRTDRSYVWPARHQAGEARNANLPPMGARFRLRASYDISHFRGDTQVVLRAMKTYGLILADNGSDWYFQGDANNAWPSALLDQLKSVPASVFDAVDASSLMVSRDSGTARPT